MLSLNFASATLGLSFGLFLIVLIVLPAIFIFEIVMFIDVIRNPRLSDERKLLWAIGMLLVHPFIAIIYYFTDRRAIT
jgi:hypothetical protein